MRSKLLAKNVKLKRAYDDPVAADGLRILVDRLWPRGVKKDAAAIDLWAKDLAQHRTTEVVRGRDFRALGGVSTPLHRRKFVSIENNSIKYVHWRGAVPSRSSTPRATKQHNEAGFIIRDMLVG